MKKVLIQIVFVVAISVLFQSCKTAPSYVFYHSEAGIPTKSSYVKTDFKIVPKIDQGLPFTIATCKDKSIDDKIAQSYLLLLTNDFKNDNEFNLHNINVTLSIENINELVKVLEKSLLIIKNNLNDLKGVNLEYSISKEINIKNISANVESWQPDFKYYLKFTREEKNKYAYLKFGKHKTTNGEFEYIYYLDEEQIRELKERLMKALELLNNWN